METAAGFSRRSERVAIDRLWWVGLLVSQVMPGANGLTVSLLMLLHVVPALVSVGMLTTLGRE